MSSVPSSASFEQFGLQPGLLKSVERLGFTQPTPIQRKAIPVMLEGRDILASAATGSGKTAAFLLPLLHHLSNRPRGASRALVLAPTRELAAQLAVHFQSLAAGTGLTAAAVYGGVAMAPQEKAFRNGTNVLIATPGRLLDHLQRSYARLDKLEFLVLDEADRMLDMGFIPDIRRILKHLPPKRQTLLFSATLPPPIVELAKTILTNPVAIHIEPQPAPARGITHRAYNVPSELKTRLLLELLRQEEPQRVLAFTRTRHRANRLADFLDRNDVACARIHGGRSQAQRTDALTGFRRGRFQVLVATDIAARGLDVTALDLVVNFDVPGDTDDYIHRVGRTARAEATGNAFTLVAPDEENSFRAIERGIGRKIQREKVAQFDYGQRAEARFEVPLGERISAIRCRKAEERARSRAKTFSQHGRSAQGPAAPRNPRQQAGNSRSSDRRRVTTPSKFIWK